VNKCGYRGPKPSDLTTLRKLISARREEIGLRAVAREIGMSPSGVTKLLTQTDYPYHPTLRKLREWQAKRSAGMMSEGERLGCIVAVIEMAREVGPGLSREDVDLIYHYASGAMNGGTT